MQSGSAVGACPLGVLFGRATGFLHSIREGPGMQRRAFIGCLGVVAPVGLAGCLDDREFARAADPWGEERSSEGETSTETIAEFTLASGEYAARTQSPDVPVEYEYRVDATNPVEVIVVAHAEFDRWRDEEEVTHFTDLHATGTQPSASGQLPAGRYVLVLDNTYLGETEPEGAVEGELQLTMRFRGSAATPTED